MSEQIQMKAVAELKFPSIVFSPIATSSPKLTRMKTPIRDHSWNSSSDESSGNVTAKAITGIDESHLDSSKLRQELSVSSCSFHTALEYVDGDLLQDRSHPAEITRDDLRRAIIERKLSGGDLTTGDAELYATVVTERILWTACRTWSGTLQVYSKDLLDEYVQYACEDWYMRNTGQLCVDELRLIDSNGEYDWQSVEMYCYDKGMPSGIVERIFEKNLVRRTTGDDLDATEVSWLLFAMIGTDEMQSIEYWFRVLDVHSDGVLNIHNLEMFYRDIVEFLAKQNVTALPFTNVFTQSSDILGTGQWTLRCFKKNSELAWRVLNPFINAVRFLEQEINEKTNGERTDDEEFGRGARTRWQRLIDHEYDAFYSNRSGSSFDSSMEE